MAITQLYLAVSSTNDNTYLRLKIPVKTYYIIDITDSCNWSQMALCHSGVFL